jgi:cell division protein FtsQ
MRNSQQVRKAVRKSADRSDPARREMPPVMVRKDSYGARGRSKKQPKKPPVRRRFDISLDKAGSQGVEMRLPSVPVVHPGWRIFSFILVVGSLVVLYALWTSPLLKVKSVQIEGVVRLDVDEITRTLGVMNETIFLLNPEEMEKILTEAYSELTNVSVQVSFPGEVLVRVTERVPMIVWVMEAETLWIDGNGYIFPPRGEAEKMVSVHANVSPPMITLAQPEEETTDLDTPDQEEAMMPQVYIDAVFFLKTQAPEGTTLLFDGHHGFGWVDPRGWQVFFGTKMDDIESKLLVYRAVVEKLEGEGITPSLINVAFVHAPYYR